MGKDKGMGKFGLALAVGAAAGYVGSLFVKSSTRSKHKKLVTMLAKSVGDKEERERVGKVFDKYTKDSVKAYRQTKANVVEAVNRAGKEIGEMDKAKYGKLLDGALKESVKQQAISKKHVEKLKKMFEADFARIKKSVAEEEGK